MKNNTTSRGSVKFAFVKSVKKALPTGIMSVVAKAVQKKKVGTVVEIAAVAVKAFGLKKVTKQDPITQTHVMLNRLRVAGVTKKVAA